MFYVKNASLGFEPKPSKNHTEDSDGDKTNTFESEILKQIDPNVGDTVLYVSTGYKLV